MLKAIFDDGLKKHAGDEGFNSFFVDLFDDIQVVAAEPGDFNVEIVVDEFEFLAERDESFVLAQEATKDIAELEDDAARVIGVKADEGGNCIERIEQEVGVDLAGQGVHASCEEELLVTLEVDFDASVVPNFQGRSD